jgi:hypothetical protein
MVPEPAERVRRVEGRRGSVLSTLPLGLPFLRTESATFSQSTLSTSSQLEFQKFLKRERVSGSLVSLYFSGPITKKDLGAS